MRLHRFYISTPPTNGMIVVLEQRLIHQWRHVLRYKEGDSVILFCGNHRDYVATITTCEKERVTLMVCEERPALMRHRTVTLFPALLKKDNFEWVLAKGTELGVRRFVPLLTERSEKRGYSLARAMKILTEATEQSGWGSLPELTPPQELNDVLKREQNLIAYDGSGTPHTNNISDPVGILIGPEGGFSPRERALFGTHRIPVYTLGPSTLRAETAAIVAAARALL